MILTRNPNCTLEIVSSGDAVGMHSSLEGDVENSYSIGDQMVRALTTIVPENVAKSYSSLEELLAEVDEHLLEVASTLNGTVIEHEWCLIDGLTTTRANQLDKLGFKNTTLGAKVKKIGGKVLNRSGFDLYDADAIHKKMSIEVAKRGWCIPDAGKARQYMAEADVREPTNINLVLFDIEPRLRATSPYISEFTNQRY